MDLDSLNNKIQKMHHVIDYKLIHQADCHADPFIQFVHWFEQSLENPRMDPNAMVLSTIDANGWPDSRVVLLKQLEPNAFVFFSNYTSKKGRQLAENNIGALNFYWPDLVRQIRIRGTIERTSLEKSHQYFATRNRLAQLSACASEQSSPINNKDDILKKIAALEILFKDTDIPCPPHWGGLSLKPFEYEFFQGQQGRIHDRFFYFQENNQWKIQRLAP